MDEETKTVLTFGAKVISYFLTFIGGVASLTYHVTVKLKGFEAENIAIKKELEIVKSAQAQCQAGPLTKIKNKLDYIIETGLPDVHKRIDAVLLKDK